jgi:hypothetical protein
MNIKRKIFSLALISLGVTCITAQEPDPAKPQILINLAQSNEQGGRIELIQPVQVENLLKIQIANNNLQKGIPGYRIRIFSGSGQQAQQKSTEIRTNFMRFFPELEAYQVYKTPNFQIFVGDFRTKNEALREKKRIERLFPGAFIVSEIINIPK